MSASDPSAAARPALLWLRRDLRLTDHPALAAAMATGRPVIPVFIWDETEEQLLGAAPRWRLMKSLQSLSKALEGRGGRLVLRRGDALSVLTALAAETDASAVHWSRYYDAAFIERDKAVKAALGSKGLEARSHAGFLLREPFETTTQDGGFYRVYSPFKRSFRAAFEPDEPAPRPDRWPAPQTWPESLALESLALDRPLSRGAAVLERALGGAAGETAAEERLEAFLASDLVDYGERRDRLDLAATSGLSAHLALGEISPRRVWLATQRAAQLQEDAARGAEKFLDEIIWREFAWHLAFHTPHIRTANWREGWDAFPWRSGAAAEEAFTAWARGRSGVDVIDAAMRELYVTGVMHNRARMIVASYLTKNLLVDWRLGERWFADCLIDFDPASNAMGWQWVAGCGPDAAPFFRIFNPETQAEKFDPEQRYRARWLPDRLGGSTPSLLDAASGGTVDGDAFFEACPVSWALTPGDPAPEPYITLRAGRERALEAYQSLRSS